MKYHVLFVIFEKNSKIWNYRLLQIIGGALRAKDISQDYTSSVQTNLIRIL